jgi:hypothetical protein
MENSNTIAESNGHRHDDDGDGGVMTMMFVCVGTILWTRPISEAVEGRFRGILA